MHIDAIELTITAQKVAESLGIGRSTLNKYSRSLEEAGYIFIKDDRGNRAYTERDIITLRHTITLLSKGITYEKAMSDAALKYARIPALEPVAMGDTINYENRTITEKNSNSTAMFEGFKQELKAEIESQVAAATESLRNDNEDLKSILQETLYQLDDMSKQNRQLLEMATAQQQLAAALPSASDQRSDILNTRLTERRVERQLERDAIDQWNSKPEVERKKKVGLFRKEEDAAARERFVREYIDKHFEDRMRKQFDS